LGSVDSSFLFECEYYDHNEVATSCNIVSNRIKKYEEKGVGPNAGEVICKGCHGLSSVETDEQLSSLTGVTFTVFTHILGLLNIVLHGNEKIN
jgi:hypothetical protein